MSPKNYPKLVIKVIYVNLRPARKYQERTPLLFFTTTFNNDNSFSLSHFTKHARINVSI